MERPARDTEPTPEQPRIDREAVLNKLFELAERSEILDLVEDDIAWLQQETLAGEDDTEFLEWLVSLAAQTGYDYEDFLYVLGIRLERDDQTE